MVDNGKHTTSSKRLVVNDADLVVLAERLVRQHPMGPSLQKPINGDDLANEEEAKIIQRASLILLSTSAEGQSTQPAENDMDFVIISEEKALPNRKAVSLNNAGILESLSFITDAIPTARIWLFEVDNILTSDDSVTVHTEAERLLGELMRVKAQDIVATKNAHSLDSLSCENHRIMFIAKTIGSGRLFPQPVIPNGSSGPSGVLYPPEAAFPAYAQTLVKECLMRSRVSDDKIRSSIWRGCRGTVFVDPFDAAATTKMRKRLPEGFFAEMGAKLHFPTLVRNQELSMALDEIDAIEAAYMLILDETPPRFSISTEGVGGPQRNSTDWIYLLDPGLMPQLKALHKILEIDWSTSNPNAALGLPTHTHPGAKLLSLDGGGVKGISSLMILNTVMEEVWKIEHPGEKSPIEGLEVHKHFQLAAGTSTGGLAAVMLFRLRMSVQEAIEAYDKFAEAIFQPLFFGFELKKLGAIGLAFGSFWLKMKMVFNRARYDPAALVTKTQEIVKRKEPDLDAAKVKLLDPKMMDPKHPSEDGKMFMCATRTDLGEVAILRSYPNTVIHVPESIDPRDGDFEEDTQQRHETKEMNTTYREQHPEVKTAAGFEDITIWEAARATSAAPTYFPEMKFKGVTFWDGGLLNNNPIDQLWDVRSDAGMPVRCILSLGATRAAKTVYGPFALVNKIKQVTGFLTDCEPKHKDFERMVRRTNTKRPDYKQIHYFRLNVTTGRESIDLADYGKMDDLKTHTKAYLDLPETREMILRCAWMLAKRE